MNAAFVSCTKEYSLLWCLEQCVVYGRWISILKCDATIFYEVADMLIVGSYLLLLGVYCSSTRNKSN